MKIVIIGGGIAGMAMGAFLQRRGKQVVICEKRRSGSERGHAFLMHEEGVGILRELNADQRLVLPGEEIASFSLRRQTGEEIKKVPLDALRCIRRNELVHFLEGILQPGLIVRGRSFSHFVRRGQRVTGAVFTNGEIEYGDVFIGADGGNSKVRAEIFGEVETTPVEVREVVGIVRNEELWQRYGRTFVKFQHDGQGLSFGMIPTARSEFVWFMQYDANVNNIGAGGPHEIGNFCKKMLRGFPAEVGTLLRAIDFDTSYVWNTKDFDLLPSFHHKNVVLVGDAAHLTLPFTSAGTTNAIVGAKALAECLQQTGDYYEAAFLNYHRQRSEAIGEHIRLGRQLKAAFLYPGGQSGGKTLLPFLAAGSAPPRRKQLAIRLKYFTDPICSTCWIIQPVLKKMSLEYGIYLDVECHMGGLLPSWDDCKGKIRSPSDAARLWNEMGRSYGMPINGDIWIDDPLSSSFPPSIAFKAAQLQDRDQATLFLRRMREMLFLEKKNIMDWQFIESAARDTGLDIPRLRMDYEGAARAAFEEDLRLAARLEVTSFPTLIFTGPYGNGIRLKGYQRYQDLELAILQLLPFARKQEFDKEPQSLFRHFPTMVEAEFALLSDLVRKEARGVLQQLSDNGFIDKTMTPNGVLWKTRR